MNGVTLEQKVALYERILKYVTGATEIRIMNHSDECEHGFVSLVGANPRNVSEVGMDEGLSLDYGSEPYVEDYGGLLEPQDDARTIVEVWFSTDPWAEIKRLEEQVQGLSERAKTEVK